MSELLLNSLPETVELNGKEFFVDTDYRTFIIFENIITSNDSPQKKVSDILELFYTEEIPDDIEEAINQIIYLYSCGDYEKKTTHRKKNGNIELKQKAIYDFDFDAPYIYAAFLTQYGIDLVDIDYLHWWKFQACFKGLEDHNKIVEIMSYRATDVSKIKDKQEQDRITRMQRIYALPQNLTTEDKVALAGAAFGGFV